MSTLNRKKLEEFLGDKKNFPLLILDEVYLNRFPKKNKNSKMKSLERKIKEKMKEEARHTGNLKKLKASKSVYLKEILQLSDNIQKNPQDNILKIKMDDTNKKVLSINEKILESEDRLLKIPGEMFGLNLDLLSETLEICYNLMRESEKMIEKIEPEMDELRERLLELSAQKAAHEEDRARTYKLLNAVAGSELIDFLDEEMSEGK